MKKAFLVELTVLTGYIKQLLPIAAIVGLFVAFGMGTVVPLAGIFVTMFSMMGAMAASAYDDAYNWGAYRLTLPVSRRSVVFGRYLAVIAMAGAGVALGLGLQVIAVTVGALNVLPAELGSVLDMTRADVLASVFSLFLCLFMGASAAAFTIPAYFKFGNTKATQFLPMFVMLAYFICMIGFGQIADRIDATELMYRFASWMESYTGTVVCCLVLTALTALVLSISAAVSLRVYGRRDL